MSRAAPAPGNTQRARWTAWALCAIIALIIGGGIPGRSCWTRSLRETEVAMVDGAPVLKSELVSALRGDLWRRGETWASLAPAERSARRDTALRRLIDDRLLAGFALDLSGTPPALGREIECEIQQFLRQFAPPDEWKQRMALQGVDEADLRRRISDDVRRLDALERWLSAQPGRIAQADVRAWFEAHRSAMVLPERVRAGHIFLTRHDRSKPDREPEIREIHRKLVSGEAAFEKLAAEHSEDESSKARGGDLGWFSRRRVPKEFADRAFAEPPGRIGSPFESRLGWHILLVREHRPERAAGFEEVAPEIAAKLDAEWRRAALKRLIGELRARARVRRFEERIAKIDPE